jgi:Protein of unknown function (DUF1838)
MVRLARRSVLSGAMGLAVGLTAGQGVPVAQAAVPAPRLPATAREGLMGFLRLFTGASGTCGFTNEGMIYAKTEGALLRPLVAYLAVLEMRTREHAPGVYRTEQKEAQVYLDPVTRAPLTAWTSTLTGETLIPVGYVSPVNVYYFDDTGSYARTLPDSRSGRWALDWRASGSDIWVTELRANSFPSSISAEEFPRAWSGPTRYSVDMLTFRGRARDFANPRLASVPSTLAMTSDTPWPLWMMMGTRPGSVIWQGFGQKYARLTDLPQTVRAPVEAAYPGFLADPWAFDNRPWGTAAQLRRLRGEGRL